MSDIKLLILVQGIILLVGVIGLIIYAYVQLRD